MIRRLEMNFYTPTKARAVLHIPPSCDAAKLREALEKIAADLIVELSLEKA